MRSSNSNLLALAVIVAAGCGPGGPGSLEGFGDLGETEGPGDGDPGDGDPGDGDPGDGDPGECVDVDFDSAPEIYLAEVLGDDASSDHAGACISAPGPDYSIAWTAPSSGLYRASVFGEFPAELAVLDGGCNAPALGCASFDVPNTVDFDAVAGRDYTLVVDAIEDFAGYFELVLIPLGGAGECPQGELLGELDSVSGSTAGAAYGFGSSCGGEEAPDHGYIFVPPVTGIYHVDMFGSSYDTMLHVFAGECGGPLVDCNDDANDQQLQSELYVQLQAGEVYTIVADGFGGDSGDYQLTVELWDAQTQLCDTVEDIGSNVPLLIEWPTDFDMGNVYNACSFAGSELRMVWTAPGDGTYRVVQTSPGNFSALTVIEAGCEGNGGPCIPADDQGAIYEFDASGGQEILFISEWDAFDPGTITLSLTEVGGGGPGCGAPLPMGAPTSASGNTLNGGNDHSASCSAGGAPEDEYWWTAPATGTYLITLEGSNYDTLMYVRDGGCDGPELACNDDTFTDQGVSLWSSVQLDLTAGQTISIFVDGYNGSGSYELAILPI